MRKQKIQFARKKQNVKRRISSGFVGCAPMIIAFFLLLNTSERNA